MRYQARSLTWHGQAFRFEWIKHRNRRKPDCAWAVSRRGEFIGTMSCSPEITTREFDLRCHEWLVDLFTSPLGRHAPSNRSDSAQPY
jgi:hypothetical protein